VSDIERWRTLLGRTTVLWARPEGFSETDTGWLAFSGYQSVEFNIAFCQATSAGGAAVRQAVDTVLEARVPSLLILAGPALGDAQVLADASWICIDSLPLMAFDDPARHEIDPAVRRLSKDDLPAVHALITESFAYTADLAAVAVPEAAFETEGQSVWGLFDGDELVSCRATVRSGDTSGGWSLATPPRLQGRGYGGRILRGVLGREASEGVTLWLSWCTPAGRRATMSVGYREVERWQVWSRPRWVLKRS